jgi:hypothetical protein
VWIDGDAVALPAAAEHTSPSPFYYNFRIGAESTSTTPIDVWIDDVAIAGTRIGCGP